MNRLFADHIKRQVFSLDGIWDFLPDPEHVGESEKWYEAFPETGTMKAAVPGCINHRLGMMEFQDVGWYRTSFYSSGGNGLIRFGAVSEYARVYLDGRFLGDHYGGFTAFEFETSLDPGWHTLVVRVDGSSTPDTIPLYAVDWHHYFGILRSVQVELLPPVSIRDLKVRYTLSEDLSQARIRFETTLRGSGSCVLKLFLGDTLASEMACTVNGQEQVFAEYTLENPRLWDVGDPQLYTVRAETELDDRIDRVGFRKIEALGKKLLLNGKPLKLKGVNRHEEHPDWGFAVPLAIMQRDMDILKDLNVNTVRGSHYPNSKAFLDLCDQEGILFWSEIPMWGFPEESVRRPLVLERGLKMHEEMVDQYFNHPSIILWSLHNEIATDTQGGYAITKAFAEKIRSLDQSRLITYATNRILKDICLDLVDLISVNQYTGWYYGEIEQWGDFMVQMKAYLKAQGVDQKPVLMSEFGTGAMFGHRNFEELRWSENYQERYFEHTVSLFLGDPEICGALLWQFCDIRSNAKWSLLRARSFNNKGLLNEYRNPKLAYYKVKELFSREWNA